MKIEEKPKNSCAINRARTCQTSMTYWSLGGVLIIIEGPVAKWIRRLTTNQEIAGSSPARIKFCLLRRYLVATLNVTL